jgi:hypothetical protein
MSSKPRYGTIHKFLRYADKKEWTEDFDYIFICDGSYCPQILTSAYAVVVVDCKKRKIDQIESEVKNIANSSALIEDYACLCGINLAFTYGKRSLILVDKQPSSYNGSLVDQENYVIRQVPRGEVHLAHNEAYNLAIKGSGGRSKDKNKSLMMRERLLKAMFKRLSDYIKELDTYQKENHNYRKKARYHQLVGSVETTNKLIKELTDFKL